MALNPESVSIEDPERPNTVQEGQHVTVSHTVYGEQGGNTGVLFTNSVIPLDADRCTWFEGVLEKTGMKVRIDYHLNGETRQEQRHCWPANDSDRRSSFTFEVPEAGDPHVYVTTIVRRQSDLEPVANHTFQIPVDLPDPDPDPPDDGDDDGDDDDPPTTETPPVVTISASQVASVGDTVTLNALVNDSDGTVENVTWTLPDGSTSSGQTVQWNFTTSGDYTFDAVATDNDGLTATDSVSVTVTGSDDETPQEPSGGRTWPLLAAGGVLLYAASENDEQGEQ